MTNYMKVEQKEKAFVPVTITLETKKEVKLLQELTNFVDMESMEKLQEDLGYKIKEDVTIDEIDDFSEDLFYELKVLI